MTKKEAEKLINQYEQGGSFDSTLLKAIRCADEKNLFELSKAFPCLVDAHLILIQNMRLHDWLIDVCAGKYGDYANKYNSFSN